MSLILENISKKFEKKEIFHNFSYRFCDTGLYLLSGASGIGKTTLLRIIAGLDKKYEGTVSGGGIRNVSYAFQEHRLFHNLTALQNLLVIFDDSDSLMEAKAKSLLFTLGFTDDEILLYPDALSGGMCQRVSLARAFLKNTPVLLLDEPVKELDKDLKEVVYNLIGEESKSRLVILVTHEEIDNNLEVTAKIDL